METPAMRRLWTQIFDNYDIKGIDIETGETFDIEYGANELKAVDPDINLYSNDEDHKYYYVDLIHNLNFYPNVTVQDSAYDLWETGILYDSLNKITLTMAQPFSGTPRAEASRTNLARRGANGISAMRGDAPI